MCPHSYHCNEDRTSHLTNLHHIWSFTVSPNGTCTVLDIAHDMIHHMGSDDDLIMVSDSPDFLDPYMTERDMW